MGKVEVTRDEYDRPYDPMEVHNKDPNYEYRWVRKNETNLRRKEHLGYEYVNATTGKGERIAPNPRIMEHKIPDGSKHLGTEYVLMRTGKADKDRRDAAKVSRARERAQAAVNRFKEEARRSGINAFEDHRDEDYKHTVEMKEE